LLSDFFSLISLLVVENKGIREFFVGCFSTKGFFKNRDFSNKPILNFLVAIEKF